MCKGLLEVTSCQLPQQSAAALPPDRSFPSRLLKSHPPCVKVFERVARSIVTASLTGFNGTIFAYGQTGGSAAAPCFPCHFTSSSILLGDHQHHN